MSIRDGGQAFPLPRMSLRDWFAGQALAGWLASLVPEEQVTARLTAKEMYEFADAMLKAREQESADEREK